MESDAFVFFSLTALQGIDVSSMIAGAATMDRLTRVADVRRNPAALLALAANLHSQAPQSKSAVEQLRALKAKNAEIISRQEAALLKLQSEREIDSAV